MKTIEEILNITAAKYGYSSYENLLMLGNKYYMRKVTKEAMEQFAKQRCDEMENQNNLMGVFVQKTVNLCNMLRYPSETELKHLFEIGNSILSTPNVVTTKL